jgi:hypothetical protein
VDSINQVEDIQMQHVMPLIGKLTPLGDKRMFGFRHLSIVVILKECKHYVLPCIPFTSLSSLLSVHLEVTCQDKTCLYPFVTWPKYLVLDRWSHTLVLANKKEGSVWLINFSTTLLWKFASYWRNISLQVLAPNNIFFWRLVF